jgi:hypothetical protein
VGERWESASASKDERYGVIQPRRDGEIEKVEKKKLMKT